MKFGKHRARRVRDELRLWLRSRHGLKISYSRDQIDRGARSLGLNGADDLMLAYTFFGGDLASPGIHAATMIETDFLVTIFDDAAEPFDLFAFE